jgi:hypothetical protein
MSEDIWETMLKREKITDFIESKAEVLKSLCFSLIYAFQQICPKKKLTLSKLGPMLWHVIKYEESIVELYVKNNGLLGIEKWNVYGDPVSILIVEEALRKSEINDGLITLKKLK